MRFLIMDALFEGGRMFVGATSIAYLLQSGLSLSNIALLKTVQALVLILGEVPTGALADTIGRKRSLLLAVLFGFVGFAFFYFGKTLPVFFIGEALTALALCFWSGAFEAFAIDGAQLLKTPGLMDRFFHLNQSVNSVTVLACGGLGGLLGSLGLRFSYLGAMVAFILLGALLIVAQEPAYPRKSLLSGMGWHLKSALHQGLLHPQLMPFFLANIGIQFVIQPVLHYWQPYFQSFGSSVGSQQLGGIFSAYCAAIAVVGLVYARLSRHTYLRGHQATLMSFCLFSILYIGMSKMSDWRYAALLFICLQAMLGNSRTMLAMRMNELIPNESRASILSSVSLISRLGALTGLWILPALQTPASMMSVFSLLSLALIASVGIGFIIMKQRTLNLEPKT